MGNRKGRCKKLGAGLEECQVDRVVIGLEESKIEGCNRVRGGSGSMAEELRSVN